MDGIRAWKALVDKFEHKGTIGKATLHSQLIQTTFEQFNDPDAYFAALERIQTRLSEMNHEVTDEVLMGIALARLPVSYQPLTTVLDTMDDLTYTVLKGRVRAYYRRSILGSSQTSSPTAKALYGNEGKDHRPLGPCFACGKMGHRIKDCKVSKHKPVESNKNQSKGDGDSSSNSKSKKKLFWRSRTKQKSEKSGSTASTDGSEGKMSMALLSSTKVTQVSESKAMQFVVDSGATAHMVNSSKCLFDVTLVTGSIVTAGGLTLKSVGYGTMRVCVRSSTGDFVEVDFHNVLIVPGIGPNLLSVQRVRSKGGRVVFSSHGDCIEVGKVVFPIQTIESLYVLEVFPVSISRRDESIPKYALSAAEEIKLWHRRFGHRDLRNFSKLEKEVSEAQLPKSWVRVKGCDVCELSKHTNISFPKHAERPATKPFETVHVDLMGPMDEESLGGSRYAVLFVDEFTKWTTAKFVAAKGDFISVFKQYVTEIGQLGNRVSKVTGIRTDRGGEFEAKAVADYCGQEGILHTSSGPYGPQQQGISERANRTYLEMCITMLEDSGLGKRFWAEAIDTAVYLGNRIPDENGQSPYHKLFKKHPRIDHVRVFGCQAYVQIPKRFRSKLDKRAWRGIFLGYDKSNWRCYRVFDPESNVVRISVHVSFNEDEFPGRSETREPIAIEEFFRSEESQAPQQHGEEGVIPEVDYQGPPVELEMLRLLPRGSNLLVPAGIPQEEGEEQALSSVEYAYQGVEEAMGDPRTYAEAMSSKDAKLWQAAMEREYDALEETGTWELVPKPPKAHVIDSKWVYKTKSSEDGSKGTQKARFVARGFSQKEGIEYDETWSPVTRMTSIRTVLSLAASEDWELHNMDVNSAFLNSYIAEEIYVRQPKGFVRLGPDGEPLVCRMRKSLYGLKQSPRNWNAVIDAWMISYGFDVSEADPCLYVKRYDSEVLIVLVWVDDLIIAGNSIYLIEKFKSAISNRFKMKDLGCLHRILGMEIKRNRAKRELFITQKAYIETLLKRFQMDACKAVGTPAEGYLPRDKEAGPNREYMRLVGSLLYAAIVSRPDISFAVQVLSRHLQGSNEEHFTAGKRVLRYLQGTKEIGLKYSNIGSMSTTLIGYADADWGGDRDTRRSVTAYAFKLGGAAISWGSKLQSTVALSSCEAEYMSASAAVQDAIHLRLLLKSLGFEQAGHTVIYEDNQGCIGMSENPILHKRSKHIDIRYHFIRECVSKGIVKLVYVETKRQLADLLTKPLLKPQILRIRPLLMGH